MRSDEAPQRIQLAAGHTANFPVDAGASLTVLSGRVRVQHPADWIAGAVLRHSTVSGEGLACRFERGGWASIEALEAAEICLLPRERKAGSLQWTWRKVWA